MLDGIPLHPLIVHGPLVLGVLAPIVALILWGAIAGRFLHHRVWWLAVFLHLAAFGGSIVAVETGEDEHDRVHDVVAEEPMHLHEERGERFRLALGGVFVLSVLAGFLFSNRKWGMRLAGLTVAGGLVAAWLALGVGHSGGALVYQEGAASYYTDRSSGMPGPRGMRAAPGDTLEPDSAAADGEEHDHDDHEH